MLPRLVHLEGTQRSEPLSVCTHRRPTAGKGGTALATPAARGGRGTQTLPYVAAHPRDGCEEARLVHVLLEGGRCAARGQVRELSTNVQPRAPGRPVYCER